MAEIGVKLGVLAGAKGIVAGALAVPRALVMEESEETNAFIIRFESDVIVTEEVTLVFTPND